MDAKTQARYEARARILKALAHPTRLYIVDELSRCKERCVCELTEMVGADMSTVSKHLSLLKEAGIVKIRKHGATVYYRLAICCVPKFLTCVENVLKTNARQRQEVLA